jgi:hypothetical protein
MVGRYGLPAMYAQIAVLSILAIILFTKTTNTPRGIRNNNAGNIRWDGQTQWLGMTGADADGFVVFSDPIYGVRAMTKILKSYNRRGVFKLNDIVSTWAPSNENDTVSYIKSVSKNTGIDADATVIPAQYPAVISALIYHENGQQPYSEDLIKNGVLLG